MTMTLSSLGVGAMLALAGTITGTDERDRLSGTAAADRIHALAKDDIVRAGGGADLVDGGTGEDVVAAGTRAVAGNTLRPLRRHFRALTAAA